MYQWREEQAHYALLRHNFATQMLPLPYRRKFNVYTLRCCYHKCLFSGRRGRRPLQIDFKNDFIQPPTVILRQGIHKNFYTTVGVDSLAAARSRSRSDNRTGLSFIALAPLRYPGDPPTIIKDTATLTIQTNALTIKNNSQESFCPLFSKSGGV